MKKGQAVKDTLNGHIGEIDVVVGDTALVQFKDRKEKVPLDRLIKIQAAVSMDDFMKTVRTMTKDDVIQEYFQHNLNDAEVEYYKTLLTTFALDLAEELYIVNSES